MEDRFVELRRCGSFEELQLLKGLLQAAGIPFATQGEMHRSMLGVMGPYIEPSLQVPASRREEAEKVLAAAENSATSPASPEADPAEEEFLRERPEDAMPAQSPRRIGAAICLAVIIPFGMAHLYARATYRGLALAALSVVGFVLMARGQAAGAYLWAGSQLVDLVGAALYLRRKNAPVVRG